MKWGFQQKFAQLAAKFEKNKLKITAKYFYIH